MVRNGLGWAGKLRADDESEVQSPETTVQSKLRATTGEEDGAGQARGENSFLAAVWPVCSVGWNVPRTIYGAHRRS
jgi:hypothetical protein